jgi:hypothetical protein
MASNKNTSKFDTLRATFGCDWSDRTMEAIQKYGAAFCLYAAQEAAAGTDNHEIKGMECAVEAGREILATKGSGKIG